MISKKAPCSSLRAVTLLELLISITIVSIMVLTIYGIYTYSHLQMLNVERREEVQNGLSYALEYMSKYVQQANGITGSPPIILYPNSSSPTGFQVRVDFNAPSTPSNLSDDAWVSYSLSGNTLTAACTGTGCPFTSQVLSINIIANFVNGTIPATPTSGFYTSIDSLGNVVDVGLVGQYYPTVAITTANKLTNPQVVLRTKIVCNNASTN